MNANTLTPARAAFTIKALAKNTARWGERTVLAAIIAATLAYLGLILLHYQPMVIVTSSMQKTIPVGSLVVDQTIDPQQLKAGDVISFRKPIGATGIDTHRIVAIKRDHGKLLYQTKGDSNPIVDPWLIHFDHGMTAHRMVFSLPYAGNVLLVLRSAPGRVTLIALACLLILSSAFKAIAATATKKEAAPPPTGPSSGLPTKAKPAPNRAPPTPPRSQTPTASALPIPKAKPSTPATTPNLPTPRLAFAGTMILLSLIGLRHLKSG
jgi:signal peptidase